MDLFFEMDTVISWLKQFGVWAVLVSLLLNIAISILGVVPTLLLSGANAVVFGMIPGFIISLLGEGLGAVISFFLYRWGIQKIKAVRSENWIWLQRLNEASRGRRMILLLIARITPLIPSGVITFAAAISSMKFLDFIIITFLGKAPSIAMETLIGHDLFFLNENLPRLAISILFVVLIISLFRKRKKTIIVEENEDGKKNITRQRSFGMGSIFIIIITCFLGLAIWGILNKSDSTSSDELQPGSGSHPHVFSYAPDGQNVWLGTHTGVYEWKDNKWKKALSPLSKNDVMGLETNPSNPENIIVSGHGFVKRSIDGGKTWEAAENGLPNQPKPDVPDAHQFTMDPKNSNHLFTLLAGRGENLFESKDGGATWQKAGLISQDAYSIAVSPDTDSTVLVATESGIYRYELNNGAAKETKISNEPAFQLLTLKDGNVIAMNEGGFVRSKDLKTWEPMKVDLNGEMPLGIKSSKTDSNKLLIVTQQLKVYESKDGGKSWAQK